MSFLISQEWISGGVPSPEVLIKNFVCPSERDPASPLQHPAIPTIAGLTARRTDSFRVRCGLLRAAKAVGNRDGDVGHCSPGPKARNRFALHSKGIFPAQGELKIRYKFNSWGYFSCKNAVKGL